MALHTRIETLPPMRVASVSARSNAPEQEAWSRLRRWAEPRGLLHDLRKHPIFGFNLPSAAADPTTRGYEWWIRVPAATPPADGVVLKDFEGGLFLVTACHLHGDPAGTLGDVWLKLWQQARTGPYRWRGTQELERPPDPLAGERAMILDLCLPVRVVTDLPPPAAPPRVTAPVIVHPT